MTDPEKLEQARALYDAGLFKKKILARVPSDIYTDTVTLACGHTSTLSRIDKTSTETECSQCRKVFEPTSPFKPSIFSRWYVTFAPVILLVIFYVWALPRLIRENNEEQAKKARAWQELTDRVTKLEERIKSR